MTKSEQQTKLQDLQTQAKDYQAELGFLALRQKQDAKRAETLEALVMEGERRFAQLQQAPVDADAVETADAED